MYDLPRNQYPTAIVRAVDKRPDNRDKLTRIEMYVRDVRQGEKKSLIDGDVTYVSRSANSYVPPSCLEKRTILTLPFNLEATGKLKGKMVVLDETFSFDYYGSQQHVEPTYVVLKQAAIKVTQVVDMQNDNARMIDGEVIGISHKGTILGKMVEGRKIRFMSFMPANQVFARNKPFYFDHLHIDLRSTDSEATLYGVDMRPREDVPFTPEYIAATHASTTRLAEASLRSTGREKPAEEEQTQPVQPPPQPDLPF